MQANSQGRKKCNAGTRVEEIEQFGPKAGLVRRGMVEMIPIQWKQSNQEEQWTVVSKQERQKR